jgi:tetratricopeptide (TPR) repeat protein
MYAAIEEYSNNFFDVSCTMNISAGVKYAYFLMAFIIVFIGSGVGFTLGGAWGLLLSSLFTGAVSAIPLGYQLYQQANTPTPQETETAQADTSKQSASEDDGSTDSEQSSIESLREQADAALESADIARERNDFSAAIDAYEEAIGTYQAALDKISVGEADTRGELETAIESTRQQLDEVTTFNEAHGAVVETLQPAERSLQEAIVAYIENDQTVARIRFRQARDTFEDAYETIMESEADLLTDPMTVEVQPDRKPSSTTLTDLPMISEAEATTLADAGIETVDDLGNSVKSPWRPAAVEGSVANETIEDDTAAALTLLSWWHGDESCTFETAEEVESRQQQADYGFNHTS